MLVSDFRTDNLQSASILTKHQCMIAQNVYFSFSFVLSMADKACTVLTILILWRLATVSSNLLRSCTRSVERQLVVLIEI
jgi:hypothetical protein